MQPTVEQKETLAEVYRAVNLDFEKIEETPNGLRIIDDRWCTMCYFDTWQALTEHLIDALDTWYTDTHRALGAIAYGEIAVEPTKIYAAEGVFDSQDDMNKYYAARERNLFGTGNFPTDAPNQDHDGY